MKWLLLLALGVGMGLVIYRLRVRSIDKGEMSKDWRSKSHADPPEMSL